MPDQHLPKDLMEIWEVEAFLLSRERLPLLSERAHTLTLESPLLFLTPLGDNLPLCSRGSSRWLQALLLPCAGKHVHGRVESLEPSPGKADNSSSRPHTLLC